MTQKPFEKEQELLEMKQELARLEKEISAKIQANQQKGGDIIIELPHEAIDPDSNIRSIRPPDDDDETEYRSAGIGR